MTSTEPNRRWVRILLAGVTLAVTVQLLYTTSLGTRLDEVSNRACASAACHLLGTCGVPVFLYGSELVAPQSRMSVNNTLFYLLLACIALTFWPFQVKRRLLLFPLGILLAACLVLSRTVSTFLIAQHSRGAAAIIDGWLWPAVLSLMIVYGAYRVSIKDASPPQVPKAA